MSRAALRLALGLPVLVWLGCAAPRGPETAAFREIPCRYELAGLKEDDPGRTVPEGTPAPELVRIIHSREPLQRRVDAVRRLEAACERGQEAGEEFSFCAGALAPTADWLLSNEKNLSFRRYGVFMLFSRAYSKAHSSLPYHPQDERLWDLWKGVQALRTRGLADKDPLLKEYFQRYVPLAAAPKWLPERKRLRDLTEKIMKAMPEHEANLLEKLSLMESMQKSQMIVHSEAVDKVAVGLPPEQRVEFIRAVEEEITYRMYAAWTNLYPRNVVEEIGSDAARRFGVAVAEVRLGWPGYMRPGPGAGR